MKPMVSLLSASLFVLLAAHVVGDDRAAAAKNSSFRQSVEESLAQPLKRIDFERTSAKDALKRIGKETGLEFTLEEADLHASGLPKPHFGNLRLENTSAREVFDQVLTPCWLCLVPDESKKVVRITSEEMAKVRGWKPIPLRKETPLTRKLRRPVDVSVEQLPLSQALGKLGMDAGVEFKIDYDHFGSDTPVTLMLSQSPVEEVLSLYLVPLQLCASVDEGKQIVHITSRKAAADKKLRIFALRMSELEHEQLRKALAEREQGR